MDFTPDNVLVFLIAMIVFVFSTTVHEFGHAAVAHALGDSTAYYGGQVSLDPTPHIRREPFGMLLLPVISFWLSGFPIGYASAPYDPRWARRYPKRQALMSAAGPLANFVLAILAALGIIALMQSGKIAPGVTSIFHFFTAAPGLQSGIWGAVAMLLSGMLGLNVLLGIFNLIPLPPMDGSGVLEGFFHDSIGSFFESIRSQPMFSILGLIVAWKLIGPLYWGAMGFILPLLIN